MELIAYDPVEEEDIFGASLPFVETDPVSGLPLSGKPFSPPPEENAAIAERRLSYLRYWEEEKARITQAYQEEVDRLTARRDNLLRKVVQRILFHTAGLRAYLQSTGQRKAQLLNGTIAFRAGRQHVEVLDEAAFLAYVDTHIELAALVRVKREPDKTAIQQHIKAGLDVPAGIDLVTGEDSFQAVTA